MRNLDQKYYLYAIGLFILASVAGLWSWNTLAELFSLPQAHYRHVLAAFVLLLILRQGLSPGHRTVRLKFGGDHEHPDH